jgi:asparagine synthase (glutamine-hydrolysing)
MRSELAAPFLAFAWDAQTAATAAQWSQALAASPAWARAHQAGTLEVWTGGPGPLPVTPWRDPETLIIGRILDRPAAAPAATEPQMGAAPMLTAARALVRDHWGSYVALLRDPSTGGWWVLRDPSGALDVLTWRRDGLAVIAADIEPLPARMGPPRPALDWDAITDFIRRPAAIAARCALETVETVAPGDLQPMGAPAREAIALWRPADWARRAGEPAADVEVRLRGAVDQAVQGLLPLTGDCLVEVSGGLDSTVVATILTRLGFGPRIAAALHFHGDRPEGDERAWAALVWAQLARPEMVLPLEIAALTAEDFAGLSRSARPAINAIDVGRDRTTAAALRRTGAAAILTGKGGDAIFFQHPTAMILADHLAAHGRRHALGPLAQDLARWFRRSVWSVAAEALRGLGGDPPAPPASPLWGPRTREPAVGAAHPWLADLADLPPAKRFQIEAVTLAQLHRGISRYAQVAPVVHPLMAQPVLELGLSIATWALVRGGRDRGLARAAFADCAPPAVLARRSKGELNAYYARTVAQNLAFLRPHLLDGCLARAGVLDHRALEAALDADALIRRSDAAGLLSAVAVESWVRHWQGRAPDSEAAPRCRG